MIHDDCVYINDHCMRLPGTLEVERRSCTSFSFAWGRFSCEIIFAFGSYADICQDLSGYAVRDAIDADVPNILVLLRAILFSCTAYFYVDISVWLFGCYSDRRAENNRETLKSMPRRRQSHAGNLGSANDKIACARLAGVLCICSS